METLKKRCATENNTHPIALATKGYVSKKWWEPPFPKHISAGINPTVRDGLSLAKKCQDIAFHDTRSQASQKSKRNAYYAQILLHFTKISQRS